ncbi:hypothetical protein, partial [Sphingomonas sp.]|uniref:hypothetical protein n=1 Tax=Sphingomonas sp. TaxID=28214 RepID=UPI0035A8829D
MNRLCVFPITALALLAAGCVPPPIERASDYPDRPQLAPPTEADTRLPPPQLRRQPRAGPPTRAGVE